MDMNYSGTEKGLKLNPRGVDHYSSLLQSTSLLINEDQDADAEKINFSISERSELLESPPIINIVPDQECLDSLKDKSLSIAVIIKEQSSRTSRVVYNQPIGSNYKGDEIQLSTSDFDNLSFSSGIHIDALIYESLGQNGQLIQGFKRFNLSFSAIAGLWSIESVDPSFFVGIGGGTNTMFFTKMDHDGEEDLLTKPAIDIVKVFINKQCVREFERLTNKSDTSGDVIRRFFVHSIIQKIALELINTCSEYPATMEEGSVAQKMFKILQIENESQYLSLLEEAKRDPEKLSMRIQERLLLSSSISKFTGGKK